jgi:beta-lactamase regulating signal transducer with metallopeptidase domain
VNTLIEIVLSNAVVACVLAIVVFVLSRALRRRPAIVHVLWMLVLVKLITPPLVSIPLFTLPAATTLEPADNIQSTLTMSELAASEERAAEPPIDILEEPHAEALATPSMESPAVTVPAIESIASSPEQPESTLDTHLAALGEFASAYWSHALLGSWLVGSACWLLVAARRVYRFERLLKHAIPASVGLQERTRYLAERLGLRHCPSAWLTPGAVSPMLWAIGPRARLILPAELVNRLKPGQLDTLLLHELAHVRRGDHWTRWLELTVTLLWWWHPVLWWARRELREVEEQCCDAWVIWALPQANCSYALALVETVEFLSETRPVLPLAASGFGQVRDLRRRLTMIMQGSTPRRLTWLSALAVLVAGAALLAVKPTLAQSDEKRPPRGEARERRDDPRPRPTEEKRDRPEGERDRAKPEEIERARNQVRELSTHLEKLQREMQEVASKLREAQQQLSRLEGRGRDGEPGAGARGGLGGLGGAGGRGGLPGAPGMPGGPSPGGFGGRGGFGFGAAAAPAGGDVERRLADLERKLDRLMQMMERGRDEQPNPPRPPERRDGERRERNVPDAPRPLYPPGRDRAPDAPRPPAVPGETGK